MKRGIFAAITLAMFVVVLAACSSAPGTSSVPTSVPSVSTAPAVPTSQPATPVPAQPTVASTSAPAQPSAAATSSSKASPNIPFPNSVGLDKLDSYEMTLRVSFKGTVNSQTVNTTDFYTRTFSLNPAAQFTTIQTTDDDGKPAIIMQGFVGDVQYARTGSSAPCTARPATSTERDILNPSVMLIPFYYGKDAGQETVNGLPARRYVMETLRNSDTEMSGEVWIAEKNAYAVKYALLIKGGETYFGKGTKGEQTMAFELRDVGAKKKVAVPNGCLPPVTDLPAMPDATNVTRSLTELSYTTASSMEKTAAFYQEKMQALGWTSELTPTVSAQPPGVPSIPGLPQLPPIPGFNPGQFLPPAFPTVAAPPLQKSWLVYGLEKEERRVYITMQLEGASLRVSAEIVQD